MADIKYVESLKIVHRDDSEEDITSSKLAFAGGSLMDITAEDNIVTLSAGSDKGTVDPAIQEKFNAVINGGSITWPGFSGAPYYFSSIGGVSPIDGHVYLLGGLCSHVGLFEDAVVDQCNPQGGISTPGADASLDITDVCPACVDCEDYEKLYTYLDKLKDALEDKRSQIFDYTADTTRQNNLLALVRQTMLYWNNMVQITSWRCSAEADGDEVNGACMITNHFDQAIPAGLELGVAFVQIPITAFPRGYIIDQVVPSDWDETDYTLGVSPVGGKTNPISVSWVADFGTKEVTLEAIAPASPPTLSPGDFASVFNTGSVDAFPDGYYEVVSVTPDLPAVGDITYVLSYPDMPLGGSGTCALSEFILLTITTNRELEIGESIRLFVAAACPTYEGQDQKAKLAFSNNVSDIGIGAGPLGEDVFQDFPSTKVIQTNKMVVIDLDGLI